MIDTEGRIVIKRLENRIDFLERVVLGKKTMMYVSVGVTIFSVFLFGIIYYLENHVTLFFFFCTN